MTTTTASTQPVPSPGDHLSTPSGDAEVVEVFDHGDYWSATMRRPRTGGTFTYGYCRKPAAEATQTA